MSVVLGGLWIIHSLHRLQFARKFPIHFHGIKSKKLLWNYLSQDELFVSFILEQCTTPMERMTTEDTILLSPSSISNDTLFLFSLEEVPFVVLQMQDVFLVSMVMNTKLSLPQQHTVYCLMDQTSCESCFEQLSNEFIFAFYFLQEFHVAYTNSNNNNMDLLHQYIAMAIPFGQPLETNFQLISTQFHKNFSSKHQFVDKKRVYPWRINKLFQSKPTTTNDTKIIMREYIQSVQYDKPNQSDYWITNGCITMQSNNESMESMEFTLDQVTHPSFHFCCQCDSTSFTQISNGNPSKLKCTPLLYQSFSLANYSFFLKKLPIRGFYQMKQITPSQLQLLLQLKLEASVNNEFEYCDVLIEFPYRTVQSCKLNPSIGSIVMSPQDKSCVIWRIGNKFKQLECNLPGTVQCTTNTSSQGNDSFFEQNNTVVKLNYKIVNYLASDAQLVLHGNVPNVTIKKEVVGYGIIWNSRGETIGLQNQPTTKI